MHATLDGDVRVRNARRKQLAQSTKVETIRRRHPTLLLQNLLQLLEEGILQDRVDNEHESGYDARKETREALIPDNRQERANSGRLRGFGLLLRTLSGISISLSFARRHARVDDPDRVCNKHGSATCQRARDHALDGRELAARAAGFDRRLLEPCSGPLVPVVVDKVGQADTEERAVETCIETWDTLTLDDAPGSCEGAGLRAFGLNLSAGGEGNERVAVGFWKVLAAVPFWPKEETEGCVR